MSSQKTDAGRTFAGLESLEPRLLLAVGVFWEHAQALQSSSPSSNDCYGSDVAVHGDYAIVGAYEDDTQGTDAGAAYIYSRSGGTWTQQQKLFASDAAADDHFGTAVDIYGDYAVVSAQMDDNTNGVDAGSVYLFRRSGSSWVQQTKVVISGGGADTFFGASVAIGSGYFVAGSTHYTNSVWHDGSAFVFQYTSISAQQSAVLANTDPNSNELFGHAVDIDGDTIVVSAPWDQLNSSSGGSVSVFTRQGSVWSLQQAFQSNTMTSLTDSFGWDVSLDGDRLLVGAIGVDTTAIGTGAAYVFQRTSGTWTQQAMLTASNPAADDDLGMSVSLDGNLAVVGVPFRNAPGADVGSAYVFRYRYGSWTQQEQLLPTVLVAGTFFGSQVAIDTDVIFAVSGYDYGSGYTYGAAFVFDQTMGDLIEPFFHEAQYLSMNADVVTAIGLGTFATGLDHFVDFGMAEGRNPSVYFNNMHYLALNADVKAAVQAKTHSSGFEHYVQYGASELRNPSAYFEEVMYDLVYLDVAVTVLAGIFRNGFQHYMAFGATEGREANLFFNEHLYKKQYSAIAAAITAKTYVNGLEHFIRFGIKEQRKTTFNETAYLAQYPAVATAVTNKTYSSGFHHYLTAGYNTGYAVIPLYNEAYYLAMNTDVAAGVTAGTWNSGLEHFMVYGQAEGRAATWDESKYLSLYSDVATGVALSTWKSGLEHFLATGKGEGRNSCQFYNETYYVNGNADVKQAVADGWYTSGLEHYILFGQYEGRLPKAP